MTPPFPLADHVFDVLDQEARGFEKPHFDCTWRVRPDTRIEHVCVVKHRVFVVPETELAEVDRGY